MLNFLAWEGSNRLLIKRDRETERERERERRETKKKREGRDWLPKRDREMERERERERERRETKKKREGRDWLPISTKMTHNGLGLQSQRPLLKKGLGLQSQAFWAIFAKNVKREMGQIYNISILPFITIKLGDCQKWQNLRRQTSPLVETTLFYLYWGKEEDLRKTNMHFWHVFESLFLGQVWL